MVERFEVGQGYKLTRHNRTHRIVRPVVCTKIDRSIGIICFKGKRRSYEAELDEDYTSEIGFILNGSVNLDFIRADETMNE